MGFFHGNWHLPNHLWAVGPPEAGPLELGNVVLDTARIMARTLALTGIFNGAQQSILMGVLAPVVVNASGAWRAFLPPHQGEMVENTVLIISTADGIR